MNENEKNHEEETEFIDLKPCPFCGGEAFFKYITKPMYRKESVIMMVCCDVCGATTRTEKCYNDDTASADFWKQDAAYAVARYWNRRTNK